MKKRLIVISTIFLIIASLIIITAKPTKNLNYKEESIKLLEKNQNECINLSIEKTANCLTENIKPYYKYNSLKDNMSITLEKILENGADCEYYSKYYKNEAEKLGFKSSIKTFELNEYQKHEITVIANETGYCIIDQIKYECFEFN